jgi:hypothetical protein
MRKRGKRGREIAHSVNRAFESVVEAVRVCAGRLIVLMKVVSRLFYLTFYDSTYRGLKGSRQRERRGFGNVSNGPNLFQTAAIDVLFSINSAVVFDFLYFRFRPSKANSIGNVLTNRQNAAKRV